MRKHAARGDIFLDPEDQADAAAEAAAAANDVPTQSDDEFINDEEESDAEAGVEGE